ncbi:MAG: TIGR01212 family radical SAM protein [Exilispira sp.]|jgi:radical SAM protein (TIGR01212 family)|nr:TIGR01212 family radical SAM protein [Exilispira sp.]
MTQKRYLSASAYFREKFGKKFRRLPVDAGFLCPGRCIYCSSWGSLAYSSFKIVKSSLEEDNKYINERLSKRLDIEQRFLLIKNQAENFLKNNKEFSIQSSETKNLLYLYFQAFSNTFDTKENLRKIYDYALSLAKFDGIFIGTRPDCIDEEKVELLANYSKHYDLWLELGLQSSHDRTLKYINRKHNAKDYEKAVKLLKSYGIKVISHIIVGLYDEKQEDLIKTIEFLNELEIDGIKFHHLYILSNTEILKYYERGIQKLLSEKEYIVQVSSALQYLKKEIVIFRLFSDPEEGFIAPKWHLKKTELLNEFDKYLEENDIWQGKLWKN